MAMGAVPTEGRASDPGAEAPLTIPLEQLGAENLSLVGGKAANLGELIRAGLPVPPGFCITTDAFARVAAAATGLEEVLAQLEAAPSEPAPALAERAHNALITADVPPELAEAIRRSYRALGEDVAVAVRSSATAEDLPEASFAGQQDTYLNVVGAEAVVEAVRACWASLWTERAAVYRTTKRVPHRQVRLAVVMQRLVPAAWAGVLFTANPLTGCRTQAVIDASPGLGEAVVSGLVTPDRVVVDRLTGRILERHPGDHERMATRPAAGGGTRRETIQQATALPDDDVLALVALAERIEQHYPGVPQDIEWAIDEAGRHWVLQTRPVTTLFPLPVPPARDGRVHAYGSLNIVQGVLGPLTPMGLDTFRRFSAAFSARIFGIPADPSVGAPVLAVAGERLYADLSDALRSSFGRKALAGALAVIEPRTATALRSLLDDPRFAIQRHGRPRRLLLTLLRVLWMTGLPWRVLVALASPNRARSRVQEHVDREIAIATTPTRGPADALDRVERLLGEMAPRIFGPLLSLVVTGVGSFRLAQKLAGSEYAQDALRLTRALPHNPTTEMDLALGALAARWADDACMGPLLRAESAEALRALWQVRRFPGGFQDDLDAFLARWGVRVVAEIDLGVPRWEDDPTHILGVLANLALSDEPARRPDQQFLAAQAEAEAAATRIATHLPPARRLAFRLAVSRMRALMGLREFPKFSIIRLFGAARRLLRQVGAELASAGRLENAEDVFFLKFAEARQGLAGADLRGLVAERKRVYQHELGRRQVPRVLLSDGTVLDGPPALAAEGALVGTPASPGVYEGTARVVLDPRGARLEPGEVLVAPSTDPGWTPLFLTAGALVMEMGGMMSHGAVVAREYGIPAVVGVAEATTRLTTGLRVRVDGSAGSVEIAKEPEAC